MNEFDDYFKGLTAMVESSFPRKCSCCGKSYATAESFLAETQNMSSGRSSLKESLEEDGTVIVEVFRNCVCGSTLMDEFNSRRDDSGKGQQRRATFDKLVSLLQKQQISKGVARAEVLKMLQGERSEVLDLLRKKS
ncbi:MAG: hypothetical protein RQ733_10430 [Methyloprofundus sp.]|nr:hypothetical protein [Methyloprofundus sp.]